MDTNTISKSKIFKALRLFAVFAMLALPFSVFATEEKAAKESEKFDPSEVILEHISDSHFWHIGGKAKIALPVIVYTNKGVETFSAAVFGEGDKVYQGKNFCYKLVNDKVKIVNILGVVDPTASLIDLSITRNVASMWFSIALLLIIFIGVANSYKKTVGKAPRGLQSFLEPIILFVRDDIAKPNIGPKYQRFMPLLLTMFFFIWINNLIGLVPFFPGGSNLTGNIAVTLVMATITLVVVNVNGNKDYWKHIFLPDVPFWLYPIMWPVELVGVLSKPFALMIRLFANITAGHVIVLSLISLIFVFKAVAVSAVSVPFVVFMDVLELLVAVLQAFIFTLLTALFIGSAVAEHHHDEHAHAHDAHH
jgi:F-type H+-transporting ATPase subunit a